MTTTASTTGQPEPHYTLDFTRPCPTCPGTLTFVGGQQEPHTCQPAATGQPEAQRELTEADKDQITELLTGRKVTKVADDTIQLDNGTLLKLVGNDGGCACSAGCYDLTELNGVDNIITAVEFEDDPDDEYREERGRYRIFVFADNQRINLATFEGTDGNGYYGTGYSITVIVPADAAGGAR